MRPYPNLHLFIARKIGIRLMYAPPYRHVPHTPLRPLVVCGTPPFAGAKLYCSDLDMVLRRRFIDKIDGRPCTIKYENAHYIISMERDKRLSRNRPIRE